MIVRTLGIVDDVKASTSDQLVVTAEDTPSILVVVDDTSSEGSPPAEQDRHASPAHRKHNTDVGAQEEMKLQAFFAGDEDLQLSSIGVFSPSQPSSPVLPGDNLSGEGGVIKVEDVREPRDEHIVLRRRLQGPGKQ